MPDSKIAISPGERDPYLPCRNIGCNFLLVGGAAYCCAPCADAHDGKYEIHDHSPGCARRTWSTVLGEVSG